MPSGKARLESGRVFGAEEGFFNSRRGITRCRRIQSNLQASHTTMRQRNRNRNRIRVPPSNLGACRVH